jgi:cytidyltransferase-like protein
MQEKGKAFETLIIGAFDDIQTRDIRFLQEADRILGNVHIMLYTDQTIEKITGESPKFLLDERLYYLQSIRYVSTIDIHDQVEPIIDLGTQKKNKEQGLVPLWVITRDQAEGVVGSYLLDHGSDFIILPEAKLKGFPMPEITEEADQPKQKKVMVSGCFDWVHTGHIRFFEEAAAFGDLYVVVGHDENLRLLKGEGHPLFPQQERLYWVQSIKHVKKAVISTGHGWLDAEPEVLSIKPDIFIVNEDGDRPEKRAFFEKHQIEYKVLKRKPKPGLPPRVSTDLRGF